MAADALLLPFFIRNVEESRFNPIHHLWHLIRGYVVFEWLMSLKIPIFTPILNTLAHTIWFLVTFIQIPIPVRTTIIFGEHVPYDKTVDTTDVVVARCHDALQQLIIKHQPHALEGRNYTRALGERWEEWRQAKPKLIKSIEGMTPKFVKQYLKRQARGGKKAA